MTELAIAAVKGVRLDPARGSVVVNALRALLSRALQDASKAGVP